MDAPRLIVTEQDRDTPMFGTCSVCRAIFPTVEANGRDRNIRLLERVFQQHLKAEHSDQPPLWKMGQGE